MDPAGCPWEHLWKGSAQKVLLQKAVGWGLCHKLATLPLIFLLRTAAKCPNEQKDMQEYRIINTS